ncbi:hypothetical protein ABMA28_001666 [Loxostege sticticalis]|uniref:TIL domain-containing protein n=1 Tax=Loxostege sticticalis TaxID=481309 RepID=A0ABD0T2I6_LOXSC
MSKIIVIIIATFWMCFVKTEVAKRSACPHNEMQVECAHCGPKRCDELGRPVPCAGGTALCRPECVCVDGYVRDDDGTCILKNECPSCGGDKNATSGCGNHCGNSCSDYKETNKTCPNDCRYNRCVCRTNYVYHDSLRICVLPDDC